MRWRLDVFREPSVDGQWVCRRDDRIRLPYDRLIVRSDAGIPSLRPEVGLLVKAKAARPKDAADLAAALPRSDAAARAWLAGELALAHPAHPWLTAQRDDA